jgi:hypothetical protein
MDYYFRTSTAHGLEVDTCDNSRLRNPGIQKFVRWGHPQLHKDKTDNTPSLLGRPIFTREKGNWKSVPARFQGLFGGFREPEKFSD